jgi:YHS domain-containing protein
MFSDFTSSGAQRPMCAFVTVIMTLFVSLVVSDNGQAQDLKWHSDLDSAIELAKREQKLILLHFTGTWSKGCQEVDTFVFSNLPVKRAILANVVPVQIDVDEQSDLTAQFGVGSVPYDIVITPGKRIVSRRQSPKDAANYFAMINRLEKTIQQIAKEGSSTVDQNLDDFQQLMKRPNAPTDQQSFTPTPPKHQIAAPSQDSQELARKVNVKLANSSQPTVDNINLSAAAPSQHADRSGKSIPMGSLKIINPNFQTQKSFSDSGNRIDDSAYQSNLLRAPSMQSPVEQRRKLSNSSTKDAARQSFVANPTAAAMSFSAEKVGLSASQGRPEGLGASDCNPNSNPPLASITVTPSATEAKLPKATQLDTPTASMQPAPTSAHFSARLSTPNRDDSSVSDLALRGNCPITLIREGRWCKGDPKWGCVHRGRTYLFVTQEYLNVFLSNPDAFSPLLAGYDPVVYLQTGDLVPGSEEHGVFMGKAPQQRVVLFQNQKTRREFEANPRKYIQAIRLAMETSASPETSIAR